MHVLTRHIAVGLRLSTSLATLVSGCSALGDSSHAGAPSAVRAAVEIIESPRPLELRLTGSREWSACEVRTPGADIPDFECANYSNRDVLARIAASEREITAFAGADSGWPRALIALASERRDDQRERAIERLESIVAKPNSAPAARSDLAVAYLARFTSVRDATYLLEALDQIERAHGAAPSSEVIAFNRAVLLDRLHLFLQARQSWTDYLRSSPSGHWSDEARRHVAALDSAHARRRARDWTSDASIAADPLGARELVMDSLLTQWTAAGKSDEARRRSLLGIQHVARVLAQSGDSSMAHVAADLKQAGPEAIVAIRSFVRANDVYRQGRFELSFPGLSASSRELRRSGVDAVARWAEIAMSVVDIYGGRHAAAERRLRALDGEGGDRSELAVRGRAQWLLGLSTGRRGAIGESVRSYGEAARIFGRTRERASEAGMLSQLADVLFLIGRDREAVLGHVRSLAQLDSSPAPARRAGALLGLASMAQEFGLSHAGLALLREAVANAPETGRAIDLSEALLRMVQIAPAAGMPDSGAIWLAQARAAERRIADPIIRRRIAMELSTAEVALRSVDDPRYAIERIDEVIAFHRVQGISYGLPSALTRRAQLRLSLADTGAAEADLRDAVSVIESQADRPADWIATRTLAAARRAVFQELVRIRLSRGDTLGAFLLAERGRGNRIDRVPERAGVLTLSFLLLPGEVITWRMSEGSLALSRRPIALDSLEARAARFETSLRRGDVDASGALGRELYSLLIAPHAAAIARAREVEIVPDGPLGRLPFAALADSAGRYLIEQVALTYASAVRPGAPEGRVPGRIVVVDNPSFDRALFPSLAPIAASEREVSAARAVYPDVRVVSGPGATKSVVMGLLHDAALVHFSGHAQRVDRAPGLSHLVLASNGGAFQSNVLTAQEISQADLHRLRLVILASCGTTQRSARRDVSENGIARAFLDAGAASVISSVWETDDESTAGLMERLHRELAMGGTAAAALRAAQVATIRESGPADARRTWSLFRLERR